LLRLLSTAVFALILSFPGIAQAQDFRDEHRVRALRNMKDVAIVVRANTPKEVASISEFADMVQVSLGRNAPSLRVMSTENSSNWLEISVIAAEQGGKVEISVYRWVRLRATGEDVVAKVWDRSESIFGGVSRQAMRESIETLVTRFSADYLRATR
jgi:hypothetical protein